MIKRTLKTDQLDTCLVRAGWKTADLARASEISAMTFSGWRSRRNSPTPRLVDKVTATLNNRYIEMGIHVIVTRWDIINYPMPSIKAYRCCKNELIARFWSKVDRRGPDECWNWTGGKLGGGYGSLTVNGERALAHRFAWEITHGLIPDGLLCLHKCDRPPCVNPNHLYIGTYSDNLRDRLERYRKPDENAGSLFFNAYPF